MLYIENIDDCNFKMYGSLSHTGVKVYSKQGIVAKSIEPGYREVQGRITIYYTQRADNDVLLNHKPVSQFTLDGTVYATAEAFVQAFNNLMAECCCGGANLVYTPEECTTTTTAEEVTTTTTPNPK